MLKGCKGDVASPEVGDGSVGGWLWHVKESEFVRVGTMYFFYVVRRDGFWAEGFASRFVNVSMPEDRRNVSALMVFRGVGQAGGTSLELRCFWSHSFGSCRCYR